ncbi:MAG TPA: GDSL-type esterase/lipase family protein, partial [Myxococcota bacterium]|nr:GDSL-type esterase/lipase family protein [Myxococcota bacterium]
HELPRYFGPGLTWQNDALGHESTASYLAEGRVTSALAAQPRYVLISFGLIDAFGEAGYQTDPTTYRQNLHQMAVQARAAGAKPIFVTSAPARWAADDGVHMRRPNGLEPWNDAMIAQGQQDAVPVVDVFSWLMDEYDRLGVPLAQKQYGLDQNGLPDPDHFSTYGADQVARHIASQLPQLAPDLAVFLWATPAPALPVWAKIGLVAALGSALYAAESLQRMRYGSGA